MVEKAIEGRQHCSAKTPQRRIQEVRLANITFHSVRLRLLSRKAVLLSN
jgi:hypothetical protein